MSDDLRQDEATPGDGVHDLQPSARELLEHRLAILQSIEEALALSSSRLAAMLSSISEMEQPATGVSAWVAADLEAPDGLGRIMLSRPGYLSTSLAGALDADSPLVAANLAIASGHAANDNSVWVGDDDGSGGVYGREPSAATLADGHTVIAWIGDDDIVHAALYAAEGEQQTRTASEQGLSQLLSNLGEAAPASGKDCGRLKVISTGPSSFAAVWLVELGFAAALAGQLFTFQPEAADASQSPSAGTASAWTTTPLPPVPVKGIDPGDISIALTDTGGFELSYSSTDDSGHRVRHLEVADAGKLAGAVGNDGTHGLPPVSDTPLSGHGASHYAQAHGPVEMQPAPAVEKAPDDGGKGPHDTELQSSQASESPDGSAFASVALASELLTSGVDATTVAQTYPNVVMTDDQNVHVLELDRGTTPETATITLTTLTSAGAPITDSSAQPQIIEVTNAAIVNDPENPSLDLTPSIAPVENAVGIAWVQSAGPEDPSAMQLTLQVYDSYGQPVSQDPIVVSTASAEPGSAPSSISSIDIAAIGPPGGEHAADHAAEQATSVLAVAWVRGADPHGYGAVNLQLFDVRDGSHAGGSAGGASSGSIEALGADAQPGGDSDTPFQVTVNDEPVVGRDPQVEGVRGGAVAVAWVAPAQDTHSSPVVSGVVIDGHNGHQLVALNLTGLMPNGVAEDSAPMLQTSSDGDIVVGWLQASDGGGYDAEAVVFKFISDGNWQRPSGAHVLAHFTDRPDDPSIGITGTDDPQISLQWSDHGTVAQTHYDLDGHVVEGSGDFTADDGGSYLGNGPGYGEAVQDFAAPVGDLASEHSGQDLTTSNQTDAQFVVVFTQAGDDATVGAKAFTADGNESTAAAVLDTVQQLTLDAPSAAAVATIVSLVANGSDDTVQTGDVTSSSAPAESSADTGTLNVTYAAELDFASDTITLLPDVGTLLDLPAVAADHAYDGLSSDDLAATIESYAPAGDGSVLPATHDTGDAHSPLVAAGNDNFEFTMVADAAAAPVDLEPTPAALTFDSVTAAFDVLQFANAFNVDANNDVIVFDTANVVTIRSLPTTIPPDQILG